MTLYLWQMEKNSLVDLVDSLGITLSEKSDSEAVITVLSRFEGNDGFCHISETSSEYILLKGIHKDFVRVLKGKPSYPEKCLSSISDQLSQIMRNVDELIKCEFQVRDEKPVMVDIQTTNDDDTDVEKRKLRIRRPLSSVEYNLAQDKVADGKMLYSKGLFTGLFPETVSPFTNSILKNILDVLNPLFMHASFKTQSPSIKLMFGKLYANYTNLEMICRTLKLDESFLQLNVAPHIYAKNEKPKIKIPELKAFDLNMEEMNSFVTEINSEIEDLTFESIGSDSFNELISLMTMASTMNILQLTEYFLKLRNRYSNWSDTLRAVYQTREENIFQQLNGQTLPEDMDVDSSDVTMSFDQMKPTKGISTAIELLPKSSRLLHKKQVNQLIQSAHVALKVRDNLMLAGFGLVKKMKALGDSVSTSLIDDCMFKSDTNVYSFESEELQNMLSGNFFGNIPFTQHFRKWQQERYQMQVVPPEIYEKDISDIPEVMGNLAKRLFRQEQISCVSYFASTEGIEIDSEDIYIARTATLTDLSNLSGKLVIVTECTSLFSFAAEYAAIQDIPLYTGVRLAPLVLEQPTLRFQENKIDLKRYS